MRLHPDARGVPDLRLRHRARMREKDIARMNEIFRDALGLDRDPFPPDTERAELTKEQDVLIANGRILGLIFKDRDDAPWLTVRGFIEFKPPKRYVTVDMGAVKFVLNGADVMAPGITEADPAIKPGDLVWIRDERNGQALAIGEAIVPGTEMPRGKKGKAVKSIHYVGDDFWNLEI